jgi:hypothetical protein
MRVTVSALNLVLGTAYTSYGVLTLIDMKRGWRTLGFSHFGAAWVAMAFTCGPHHLAHGLHQAFEGRATASLDLVAVLVGLPFGVIWLMLRVEGFLGGSGDRFIAGTPRWLLAGPYLAAAYTAGLAVSTLDTVGGRSVHLSAMATPNLLLVSIYMTIGYFLLRTQLMNRKPTGGWSVSGCSLTVVFPTCALMHAVFVAYSLTGVYAFDLHGFGIDWLGVPAGLYFLWVVRSLYQGRLRDWNQDEGQPSPALVG